MTKIIIAILSASIFASGGWQLGSYISDVWSPENKLPLIIGLSFLGVIFGGISGPLLIIKIANRITLYSQEFTTSRLLSISLGMLIGLFFGLGIWHFVYKVFIIGGRYTDFTIFIFIIGILIFLLGLISEQITQIRYDRSS